MAGRNPIERRGDHDLLVQLTELVKYLQLDVTQVKADVKELKENTSQRVDALERVKLDKAEALAMQNEIEKTVAMNSATIDMLKTRINIAYGVVIAATFVIPLIVAYIVHSK